MILGDEISAQTNRRVVACHEALQRCRPPGVVDLIPSYCALLALFDPRVIAPREVAGWLGRVPAVAQETGPTGRLLTVPVWYDPSVGLDLVEVASGLGLSGERVIELHTSREYLVFMLGFLPGFPYLGELDERLVVGRRPTPRQRVPARSVAIAGRQTGIYPVASPGGWRILGRTPMVVFDPRREAPFTFRAGDRVRFEAIDEREYRKLAAAASCEESCEQWERRST